MAVAEGVNVSGRILIGSEGLTGEFLIIGSERCFGILQIHSTWRVDTLSILVQPRYSKVLYDRSDLFYSSMILMSEKNVDYGQQIVRSLQSATSSSPRQEPSVVPEQVYSLSERRCLVPL